MQHSDLTITCALRVNDNPIELIVLRNDCKLRLLHNEAAMTYVFRLASISLSQRQR